MEAFTYIPNGQYDFFSGKSILFVIPHPDDEINLAGGLIYWLYKIGAKVILLYTTNGNHRGKGKKRISEVYKSIKHLGGKSEDVIFLGYSDQAVDATDHLYTSDGIWKDRHGNDTTYILGAEEYCFKKNGHHNLQTRANFINDIKDVILEYRPDIIFSVDFDSHVDHRAASLGFECAMGEILSSEKYRPIVFKSFAYPLAYNGKKDFRIPDIGSTVYNHERFAGKFFANPYYKWEERVRFALPLEARRCFLPKNPLYRALRSHRSQSISGRADRIINNDNVAWIRRTDSLLYDARIDASSGDESFLNDFLLFDCSNILGGNAQEPIYDSGAWVPDVEDNAPTITIKLNGKMVFNKVLFYQTVGHKISCVEVKVNGESQVFQNPSFDLIWEIPLAEKYSDTIIIKILGRDSLDAGLTEIELYKDTKREVIWSFPLIGEEFFYRDREDKHNFETGLYNFDGIKGTTQRGADNSCPYNLRIENKLVLIADTVILKSTRLYYAIRRCVLKRLKLY